ncbi:MAG TPA: chemotaxis protein CheW [Bacteriovoracaceae bacterium]|nr:chemotaxis protein CheW [Bacteriovoracaceae bacterium]
MNPFKQTNDVITVDSKRFLEFALGKESYAIELLKVKEVITPPEMTPIPKAPSYVCGLMNLRGLVLTVIDLRKKLSITPSEDTSQNGVIIFDLGERLVGVVVDSIQRVLNVEEDNIKPVPDSDKNNSYILGVLQQESKLVMWIDPSILLDADIRKVQEAA